MKIRLTAFVEGSAETAQLEYVRDIGMVYRMLGPGSHYTSFPTNKNYRTLIHVSFNGVSINGQKIHDNLKALPN